MSFPRPTPNANERLCVQYPIDFCSSGSEKEIPFVQIMNLIDASQPQEEIMCAAWAHDHNGEPLTESDGTVSQDTCFVKSKDGSLVPNPFTLFRPMKEPIPTTIPSCNVNLGSRVNAYVFAPMSKSMLTKSCKDWQANDSFFSDLTGALVLTDYAAQTTEFECDGCYPGVLSTFGMEIYDPSKMTQRFSYFSNYEDACGMVSIRCGSQGTHNDKGQLTCTLPGGTTFYPTFFNFDRSEDVKLMTGGCPAMLTTKLSSGNYYPPSVSSSRWAKNFPPAGGVMPDGGPFPGAFFKLNYGTLNVCTGDGDCQGGKGGKCEEDPVTGFKMCNCSDPNAIGDCSSCVSGYEMDPVSLSCVKPEKPSKKILGIPEQTFWIIAGFLLLVIVLVILYIRSQNAQVAKMEAQLNAPPDPLQALFSGSS